MLDQIKEHVERLALPRRQAVWQGDEDGDEPRRLRVVFSAPLLDQLYEAVASGSGTGSAGVGEKRTRSIIDADALDLWWSIRRGIRDLYNESAAHAERMDSEPKEQLVRWFRLFATRFADDTRKPVNPEEVEQVYHLLSEWVVGIESKFDPPRVIEILQSCPNSWLVGEDRVTCGQRYWKNAEGVRSSALVANVWVSGLIVVHCRACNKKWNGIKSIQRQFEIPVFLGEGDPK